MHAAIDVSLAGVIGGLLFVAFRRRRPAFRPDYSHLPAFLMGETAAEGQAVRFAADGRLYLAPPTWAEGVAGLPTE